MEVGAKEELTPEIREFIDQLIVPLLVDALLRETGHLYTAGTPSYDDEVLAEAAKEAA